MGNKLVKRQKGDEEKRTAGKKHFLGMASVVCLLAAVGVAVCVKGVFRMGNGKGASGMPEFSDEVNQENVMVLLNAYDEDGAYLVDYGTNAGDDWLAYYYTRNHLLASLDTVVHEECHVFTDAGEGKERIYEGDGKSVEVPYTEVYESREMADSVPERCRGTRFSTYISEPKDGLLANVEGAYGLLNEFNAYSWGMNNVVAMYPYRDGFADDIDTWDNFFISGASNRIAYAEMKYYLLHYLRYAKKNYPDVYRQIAGNEAFRLAYKDIDDRYAAQVADFEECLAEVEDKLRQAGYEIVWRNEDHVVIGSKQYALMTSEYNTFLDEMAKKPYVSIQNELTGEASEE